MEFYYTYRARDNLRGLPALIQKRIAKKMRFYAAQKDPLKFAERLTDSREGEFRFRVGDYRIFFDVVKNKIIVLKIYNRKDAY
ncbi:MAG: type II toxin-antitoxin system RelE/ParE family toxin [Patescibacteria group bacterium]